MRVPGGRSAGTRAHPARKRRHTQQRTEPEHPGQLGRPCLLVLCAVTDPRPADPPETGHFYLPARRAVYPSRSRAGTLDRPFQGARAENDGLLGNRPRATALRVAPGEARGHVVSSRLHRSLTAMLTAEPDDSRPPRRPWGHIGATFHPTITDNSGHRRSHDTAAQQRLCPGITGHPATLVLPRTEEVRPPSSRPHPAFRRIGPAIA
jgi:hypothetical protein